MQTAFGPELRQKVLQYLLGKYQGDSEWFRREVGEPMSLKELIALVQERYPLEVKAVLRMVTDGLCDPDPNEWERRENVRRAMRDFGVAYGWDLPPGVPGVWTLEQYRPDPRHPATAAAREAVEAWLARRGPPILVLAGPPGVGKSHLADGAGSWLLARGQEVVLRDSGALFEEFHQAVAARSLEDRLHAYEAIPWLILDDFGLSAATDWAREIQDRLVNARWVGARGGLRTMVTTNLKGEDLPPRVASRLADRTLGAVVQVAAPDYRKRRVGT